MLFYDKKKKPNPPPIPLTINGESLKRVFTQRILGIIIDNNLSFSPHIENITNKCKRAYNRLALFPDMRPDLAIQIYKSFVRSKLEYGSAVWGHTLYNNKHLRLLEAAQKGALMLILRSMKSTPLDAMEAELGIAPIDLRIQELQRTEAVKLFQKHDEYISGNMDKKMKNKLTPLSYLGHLVKQVLSKISKDLKTGTQQIKIPKEIPPSFELFSIPNMTITLPNKISSEEAVQSYIHSILNQITDDTMIIFTDGSAQNNPGPVGSGVVIKGSVRYIFHFLFYLTKRKPIKNDEKWFLFHVKSSFRSQDIKCFVFPSCLHFCPVGHCWKKRLKIFFKIHDVMKWLNKDSNIHIDRYLRL